MNDVEAVTKHYGDKVAVRELSFTVRPGVVTPAIAIAAVLMVRRDT